MRPDPGGAFSAVAVSRPARASSALLSDSLLLDGGRGLHLAKAIGRSGRLVSRGLTARHSGRTFSWQADDFILIDNTCYVPCRRV